MKEIQFQSDHPPDIEELKKRLFEDPSDPRSRSYVRVLIRPRIRWWSVALQLLLPLLAASVAGTVLHRLSMPVWAIYAVPAVCLVLYTLLRLKSFFICAVRIYQRLAPDSIRNKCRFEPSCSQYMILSLEKYGLCKGLHKGVCRLKRCNIRHGGFDEP